MSVVLVHCISDDILTNHRDEADRLLDMDFGPILDKILKVLPRERRTFLFSATLSSKVESLQRASLSNPMRVSISSSKYQTVSNLKQYFLLKPLKHKDFHLVYLLNEFAGQSAIVFARTVHETQRVSFLLRALGFGAIPLHGMSSLYHLTEQLSDDSQANSLNPPVSVPWVNSAPAAEIFLSPRMWPPEVWIFPLSMLCLITTCLRTVRLTFIVSAVLHVLVRVVSLLVSSLSMVSRTQFGITSVFFTNLFFFFRCRGLATY